MLRNLCSQSFFRCIFLQTRDAQFTRPRNDSFPFELAHHASFAYLHASRLTVDRNSQKIHIFQQPIWDRPGWERLKLKQSTISRRTRSEPRVEMFMGSVGRPRDPREQQQQLVLNYGTAPGQDLYFIIFAPDQQKKAAEREQWSFVNLFNLRATASAAPWDSGFRYGGMRILRWMEILKDKAVNQF